MPQQKYKFHCLEIKYTYRILWSLFGGLFLLIAALIILGVNHLENLFLPVLGGLGLLTIGTIAYYIVKAVRSSKKPPEKIRFSSLGMHTERFGHIYFKDISSYRIKTGLSYLSADKSSPSLCLKLKDGRNIRYDLNANYYDEEIDDYMAFIDDFVEAMAPSENPERSTSASLDNSTQTEAEYERRRDHERAEKGLEKAKKWRGGKIAIPVSLAVALIFFLRMCGPDIVEHFKDHPLRDLRQSTYRRYDNQIDRMRQAMLKEGKVFMFTNDSTARVRLYPNMQIGAEGSNILLQKSETASNIAYFLDHADSLGYRPVVVLPDFSFKQSARFPLPDGKNIKYLYFMVYDSQNQLQNVGGPNKKTLLTWAVAYKNVSVLKDSINSAFPSLKRFDDIFDTVPGFYLYVTASESSGTSRSEFKKAVNVVKGILRQNEVDVSAFKISVFNMKDKKKRKLSNNSDE